MVKKSDTKSEKNKKPTQPADPEAEEKKRLRSLALSKRLLRRDAPAEVTAPLRPAKSVVKLDGRDVVKRGQRKSRFLFSFPGLLAPLSGGRIGELACLASKNPILYLEFPQGRMKLFGTHVYPKNKYLALQLTRSSKGVMCEDIFESLHQSAQITASCTQVQPGIGSLLSGSCLYGTNPIVFSEAWWIGTKEENPEELRHEFPQNLQVGKEEVECDFKGGAGATEEADDANKLRKDYVEPISPDLDLDKNHNDITEGSEHKVGTERKNVTTETPVRQSSRVSKRSFNYAESSPSDASDDTDDEDKQTLATVLGSKNVISPSSSNLEKTESAEKRAPTLNATESSLVKDQSSKKPKVQATVSSLFQKAAAKKEGSSNSAPLSGTRKSERATPRRNKSKVLEVEEISSGPEEGKDDSDEDWAA